MKLLAAIFICKLIACAGKLFGRGSSLPGKVALRLCPDALRRLMLPGCIIAVTGSNGKTSTVQFIAHALKRKGMRVAFNREGSNQTDGIASLLLRIATYQGAVNYNALVLECDERYAAEIFSQVRPSTLVITNLCRDQLSRNGHHEFVSDCLRKAVETIRGSINFVLNADDPYVAALADYGKGNFIWYAIGQGAGPALTAAGVYDDGAFCPCCKKPMTYKYRIAAHFGGFICDNCGFTRSKADIEVSHLDYESGEIIFAGQSFEENEHIKLENLGLQGAQSVEAGAAAVRTQLSNPGLGNAYNMAAALTAAKTAGVSLYDAARYLNGFELTGGRTMAFSVGRRDVTVMICKHENSLAYNLSMSMITGRQEPCSVLILVNSISRKYYTCETSWLWDIDFDILADDCIKKIILAGRYAPDLTTRFAMSSVDLRKCAAVTELPGLRSAVAGCKTADVYVLTCFADKAGLLKELGVRN